MPRQFTNTDWTILSVVAGMCCASFYQAGLLNLFYSLWTGGWPIDSWLWRTPDWQLSTAAGVLTAAGVFLSRNILHQLVVMTALVPTALALAWADHGETGSGIVPILALVALITAPFLIVMVLSVVMTLSQPPKAVAD